MEKNATTMMQSSSSFLTILWQ